MFSPRALSYTRSSCVYKSDLGDEWGGVLKAGRALNVLATPAK